VVKEPSIVALGCQDEKNIIIFVRSRSKVLPEPLALRRAMVNKDYHSQDGKRDSCKEKLEQRF